MVTHQDNEIHWNSLDDTVVYQTDTFADENKIKLIIIFHFNMKARIRDLLGSITIFGVL